MALHNEWYLFRYGVACVVHRFFNLPLRDELRIIQRFAKVLIPQNEGNYGRYEGSIFPTTAVFDVHRLGRNIHGDIFDAVDFPNRAFDGVLAMLT